MMTMAVAALLSVGAQAQSPQAPQKEPGTQPSKDGSAAQKQYPDQPGKPGDRDKALQPNKAPANSAKPGAGSDKPVPAPESPEQHGQKPANNQK